MKNDNEIIKRVVDHIECFFEEYTLKQLLIKAYRAGYTDGKLEEKKQRDDNK